MGAKDAERIIEALYSLYTREVLLTELEALNEDINQLIQKLQESAALSGLRLRQFYKHVEEGKEHYLLQVLDGKINSLQFYDIITQKLDHLLRTHFILIEDLKRGLRHQDVQQDAESFLIIFPELMKLHQGLLKLIREEYVSEIDELQRHFMEVTKDQIPKDSVDIQLEYYRKTIEQFLKQVIEGVEAFSGFPDTSDSPEISELKSHKFQHVISLYTMNSEREVFRRVFGHKPFLSLVEVEDESRDAENDVELF